MKKLYALFFLLFSTAAFSQYNFKPIDSLLATYNKPGSPGAVVQVIKDGKVIYSKQSGYADIEHNELLTDKSVFSLASVSKQFTAACIVLLEQKGKLSLNDKLSKYFPDFPEYAQKVTLKDLLNHTSGIKDYRALIMIKGQQSSDFKNKDIRKMLSEQELDFKPGTKFSYSNSGYWLLEQIVEQVSGESIISFAETNIFKPLKMTSTTYTYKPNSVQNRAIGYEVKDGVRTGCPVDEDVIAGSGVVSTADDLVKWLTEIENKQVLGAAFWNRMLNEEIYKTDKNGLYTKGLFIDSYGGYQRIYHEGDIDGFHNVLSYFPERKVGVVVLSNDDDADTWLLQRAAVNLTLGLRYRYPKPKAPNVVLPKQTLEQYAGAYMVEGVMFEITAIDNGVHVLQLWDNSGYDIQSRGEALFSEDGVDLLFEDIVDGKAQVMQITQDGEKLVLKRVALHELPDHGEFSGVFRSKSLGVEYSFFVKDQKLVYSINGGNPQAVSTIDEDSVSIKQGTATFLRGRKGVITGFTLNHPRAKNLEFVKI